MKLLFALTLAACASLGLGLALRAPTVAPAPLAYEFDTGHSSLLFRAKHLGIAYVYGRFNEYGGKFVYDAAQPESSSVEVEVKMESVDTGSEKRDGHLKSPDFFDAKQFPTATFKSKSVKKGKEGRLEIAGDFTLHGVTKPVTIDVESVGTGKDPWGGERAGFHGTFTIKRSEFGMDYSLENLSDDVQVTISIQGVAKGAEKK